MKNEYSTTLVYDVNKLLFTLQKQKKTFSGSPSTRVQLNLSTRRAAHQTVTSNGLSH